MTDTWEGAQWALATYFACVTFVNTFVAPYLKMRLGQWNGWPDFAGWWIGEVGTRAALAAVLYWGGFWT